MQFLGIEWVGVTPENGRTTEQLGAISGALTLLANIVMAWNTRRIQAMIDRAPNDHPDEVLSRFAPIGHKHINMRGILTFDLARYASDHGKDTCLCRARHKSESRTYPRLSPQANRATTACGSTEAALFHIGNFQCLGDHPPSWHPILLPALGPDNMRHHGRQPRHGEKLR